MQVSVLVNNEYLFMHLNMFELQEQNLSKLLAIIVFICIQVHVFGTSFLYSLHLVY